MLFVCACMLRLCEQALCGVLSIGKQMNLQTAVLKLLLVICLGSFSCVAPAARGPVGVWVIDPDETERFLLEHPPVEKLDAGFVWLAGLSCYLVITVTRDDQLFMGPFGETDKVRFLRNQGDASALRYESVGRDGKLSKLTLTSEGAHLRVDDGDGLRPLLWKRTKVEPSKKSFTEAENMACLTPLERVWKRYGPQR